MAVMIVEFPGQAVGYGFCLVRTIFLETLVILLSFVTAVGSSIATMMIMICLLHLADREHIFPLIHQKHLSLALVTLA